MTGAGGPRGSPKPRKTPDPEGRPPCPGPGLLLRKLAALTPQGRGPGAHRRGPRMEASAAGGGEGGAVRGKEHPLSGRRETQCRLQSPPPQPRGPRRWRCVGRDGGPETRRGRNAGDGNASVHVGSPRATTPLLPALLSPTPGPADCGGTVSQAQAVRGPPPPPPSGGWGLRGGARGALRPT